MIIFTPIKDIPIEYLEFKGIRQVIKYNLSSYYNDFQTLEGLIPLPGCIPQDVIFGDATDPIFDIEYHNYIINNPASFLQFMSIIIPAYQYPDIMVQVLIQPSNYRDIITESLLKLIQQRYGYTACIVNEIDDFIYAIESDFSIPGLFALDQDLARWRTMVPCEDELYE